MEEKKRTFARTAIWRVCAYCGTSVVMYILTKDLSKAFSFGLIDHSIKFICQYFYERMWNKLSWGLSNGEQSREGEEFEEVL